MKSADAPQSDGNFLALDDPSLLAQCSIDHYRSHGPGGQKRNKTSSAVRLRHGPTGLIVTATEDRSSHVNLAKAIRRLREAIALEWPRTDTHATPVGHVLLAHLQSSKDQTPTGGIAVGRRDPRYFACVQDALALLHATGFSVRDAAARIGLTTAQFVKILQADAKLLHKVNEGRGQRGMRRLA